MIYDAHNGASNRAVSWNEDAREDAREDAHEDTISMIHSKSSGEKSSSSTISWRGWFPREEIIGHFHLSTKIISSSLALWHHELLSFFIQLFLIMSMTLVQIILNSKNW